MWVSDTKLRAVLYVKVKTEGCAICQGHASAESILGDLGKCLLKISM